MCAAAAHVCLSVCLIACTVAPPPNNLAANRGVHSMQRRRLGMSHMYVQEHTLTLTRQC